MRKITFYIFLLISTQLFAQTDWTQKANFPGVATAHNVGFSIGHYGFVGCGQDCSNNYDLDFYKYNANTNSWTAIPNYPGGGQYACAACTIEGKGYVGFGWNGSSCANDLWRYDTISNSWTQMAPFPGTPRYSCFPFVIGHKAYFVGGSTGGPPYLSDVWVYDAHQNTWKKLNTFPLGDVESYVSFAIGNHGYAGEGYYNPGCYQTMYEYDTTNDSWTTITPIPITYGISANPDTWVMGSKAFICTGNMCTNTGLRDGWMYDTVTKSWCEFSYIAAYQISRGYGAAFCVNNHGYICTGYDTNQNCLGDLWEYTPSLKFSVSDTNRCANDTAHFSGITNYLNPTWSWSFPGGSPATSNLQNPDIIYSTSGSYRVTLIVSACGIADTLSRIVTIAAATLPGISINGQSPVCSGTSDTIVASGGTTYNWSNGATTSSIIISPSSTTTYTVAISKGCLVKDTSITIAVTPLPITLTGRSGICTGDTTTLNVTGGGTYLWSNGATTSSITISPNASSIYTVKVSKGCSKDTSILIIVSPIPSISLSGKDSVCFGNSTTLNVRGGGSYLWSNGATTSSITVRPNNSITYTIAVTDNGCQKDTTENVIISPLPSVTIFGKNAICAGDSTTLSSTGGGTYKWNNGATTNSITVHPLTTETYSLTVSDNGCPKDTTITVNVTKLVAGITAPTTICDGDSVLLTSSGGGAYIWNNGATTSSIMVKPSSNNSYSVVITNGACIKDTSVTVTVNPTPVASIHGINHVCKGDSVVLTATGGGTYQWSTGQTSSNISVTPSSNSVYTVVVIGTDGCKSDTTFEINVNTVLGAIKGPGSICLGDSIKLIASGGGTYLWSTGTTNSSITIAPPKNTTYNVVVNNGCVDTVTKTIFIDAPVLYACCDTVITSPDMPVVLNASGTTTYYWEPSSGVSCDSCPNPIVTPTITTTYTVIGIDSVGCRVERTVTIDVSGCYFGNVPNVFTPNGDGINDNFVIYTFNILGYSISIYDRWGLEMFHSTNPNEYWDGNTQSGGKAPEGVYYYILNYSCYGKSFNKDGFLQLVR